MQSPKGDQPNPSGPIPFSEVRSWMFEDALPFWADRGVDREHGGFLEELSLDGRPTDVDFKRTRAFCRQVYVFSHASLLGWAPGLALSEMGFRYLVDKAWLGDERGWAKRLSRAGAVIDATPDLYDLSFVLFALAWRYRASGDLEAKTRAHQTLDFIELHLRVARGEGFWHWLPPSGPRLQNPHMHLLETCLACFEAFQEQRFLDQAKELVGLFRTRFFDGRTLGEYFTDDLQRVAGAQGRLLEPGHQFEWGWILGLYQRHTGTDLIKEATGLVDFAERFGVEPTSHATFDEIRDDGVVLKGSSRTWPNTERLKGHLAVFELTGGDQRAPIASAARVLLDRYLNVTPRGLWMDQFDAQGRPVATAAPASTFYHVFLAFSELLRLEQKLNGLPA